MNAVDQIRIYAFVGVLIAGTACVTGATESPKPAGPVSGGLTHALAAADIPELERLAMRGDSEAAIRLSKHYMFAVLDKSKHDHWVRIAAENGSLLGMYNYAASLRQGNALDVIRAKYWLERVIQAGPSPLLEDAKQILGLTH